MWSPASPGALSGHLLCVCDAGGCDLQVIHRVLRDVLQLVCAQRRVKTLLNLLGLSQRSCHFTKAGPWAWNQSLRARSFWEPSLSLGKLMLFERVVKLYHWTCHFINTCWWHQGLLWGKNAALHDAFVHKIHAFFFPPNKQVNLALVTSM